MKKRGILLTALLIVSAIGSVAWFFNKDNYSLTAQAKYFHYIPFWYTGFLFASTLVRAITLVFIWFWQKWGIYLSVGNFAVSFLLLLVMRPTNLVAYVVVLVAFGLSLFILLRKWQDFE